MSGDALLDDLIAKLREMEEQLSMAHLETTAQTLLASRIRQLTILATYVRSRLETMAAARVPPKPADESQPDKRR